MWCVCAYNPARDITPVDQFGYVDLGKALVEGVVPYVDGLVDESFNNIDDPRSILGAPRNSFDAMEFDKVIRAYVPPADSDNSNGE